MATVLVTWFYAIQVYLAGLTENRFIVMQNNENFRSSCLAPTECSRAKMSLHVIRHTLEDNMRHVKIGFHDTHGIMTFYLTASSEVGREHAVAATEDFDEAVLFELTVEGDVETINMYDPVSERYLHAMPTAECAVGELIFVDKDDPARNESIFKIHGGKHPYFNKGLSCC